METLLIAGIIGVGAWLVVKNQQQQQQQAPPPVTGPQPCPPGMIGTPPNCTTPPAPAPPPVTATGPGVYPPGTPGAFPIIISVSGGACDSTMSATPGDSVGPCPGSKTIWYGPGTLVTFRQSVQPSFGFVNVYRSVFDHFEGPGVRTTQPSFQVPVNGQGWVTAVFKPAT